MDFMDIEKKRVTVRKFSHDAGGGKPGFRQRLAVSEEIREFSKR